VSFQVNGIVTFFGKQTHILTLIDLNRESASKSFPPASSVSLYSDNSDLSTPSKKAQLHRKVELFAANLVH
jgi:hypothetical protein